VDPEADNSSQFTPCSDVQIVNNVTFATQITCLMIGVLMVLSRYASHLYFRKNVP